MTVFVPRGAQLLEQVSLSADPFGILRSASPRRVWVNEAMGGGSRIRERDMGLR